MQKSPTYIGIFAKNPKEANKDLRQYAKDSIQDLACQVNSILVQNDFKNFQTTFNAPKDNYHITLVYIGGKVQSLKQKQSEIYKGFKHDVETPIIIDYCVYVPGSIIVGYSPNIGQFECDNKHPHVTLFLSGDVKPVQSNDVLQQILKEEPQAFSGDFTVKPAKAKFLGKSVFIIKKKIQIPGFSGDNFKYGNRK